MPSREHVRPSSHAASAHAQPIVPGGQPPSVASSSSVPGAVVSSADPTVGSSGVLPLGSELAPVLSPTEATPELVPLESNEHPDATTSATTANAPVRAP